MPMLTTLRMRLPVWPFHAPLRTRFANAAIRSSTACTSGTTFSPSTTIEAPGGARSATCRTARFSVDVDLLAAEHRVDPRAQAGLLGELDEEAQRLVGDAVLRVVEVDPRGLRRQALAARRIVREELAQMHAVDGRVMRPERVPRRPGSHRLLRHRHPRAPFAVRLRPRHMRNPPLNALALSPSRQPGGELFQLLHVAAAEHHLVRLERRAQALDDVEHRAPPLLLAETLEAADAEVVLVGPLPVRQVAELHRLDDAVDDEGRAEPGAEAEEEHLPAPVAAERLHRRVVHHLRRAAGTPWRSRTPSSRDRGCAARATGRLRRTGPG